MKWFIVLLALTLFVSSAYAFNNGSAERANHSSTLTTSIPFLDMMKHEVAPARVIVDPLRPNLEEQRSNGMPGVSLISVSGKSRLFRTLELTGRASAIVQRPTASLELKATW